MANTVKQEKDLDKLNHSLINTFRAIAELAGFEICGRIVLKHKKTGRMFR